MIRAGRGRTVSCVLVAQCRLVAVVTIGNGQRPAAGQVEQIACGRRLVGIDRPQALTYATRTGRDVSGIGYYIAFGCWRLAVISEGVYSRYVNGAMADSGEVDLAVFKESTATLAERAREAIKQWG